MWRQRKVPCAGYLYLDTSEFGPYLDGRRVVRCDWLAQEVDEAKVNNGSPAAPLAAVALVGRGPAAACVLPEVLTRRHRLVHGHCDTTTHRLVHGHCDTTTHRLVHGHCDTTTHRLVHGHCDTTTHRLVHGHCDTTTHRLVHGHVTQPHTVWFMVTVTTTHRLVHGDSDTTTHRLIHGHYDTTTHRLVHGDRDNHTPSGSWSQ